MAQQHQDRGFIILISVLLLAAVGLSIGVYLVLTGLGFSRSSYVSLQSVQARGLATACANEALQQIHDDTNYIGSGNLTLGAGVCNYVILTGGGSNRTVNSSGTVGTIVRKISISITSLSPVIGISSWQEVAD